MNQEIFAQATEQFTKLTAPAKKLNALLIAHMEKLAQFQIEAAKDYSGTGIAQLRSALDIEDAKALQTYLGNQPKVAEQVAKKLTADAEALTKLNQALAAEVQKLAQEAAQTLTAAVQPAKKAPAKK